MFIDCCISYFFLILYSGRNHPFRDVIFECNVILFAFFGFFNHLQLKFILIRLSILLLLMLLTAFSSLGPSSTFLHSFSDVNNLIIHNNNSCLFFLGFISIDVTFQDWWHSSTFLFSLFFFKAHQDEWITSPYLLLKCFLHASQRYKLTSSSTNEGSGTSYNSLRWGMFLEKPNLNNVDCFFLSPIFQLQHPKANLLNSKKMAFSTDSRNHSSANYVRHWPGIDRYLMLVTIHKVWIHNKEQLGMKWLKTEIY